MSNLSTNSPNLANSSNLKGKSRLFYIILIQPIARNLYRKSFSLIRVFKFFMDTCPFVGPLIPLFWTSGDVSSGFQSQSGQPYSHFGGGIHTSGVTHFPVYNASIAAGHFPYMRVSAELKTFKGFVYSRSQAHY